MKKLRILAGRLTWYILIATVASLISLSANPVSASETKYWLDDLQEQCTEGDSASLFNALAYSPAGYAWCKWKKPSLKEARRAAIKRCNEYVPRKMRKLAPCKIIAEEGIILDDKAFNNERRKKKIPVSIETFDALNQIKKLHDGFLLLPGTVTNGRGSIALTYPDGSVMCHGTYKASNIRKISRVTCFDEFSFSKNHIRNLRFIRRGEFFDKVYDMDFSFEGSYVKVRPKFQ